MVFRGTDGKARRLDCYCSGEGSVTREWDKQRRSLFKKKVFFVEYDGCLYWLRVSPGFPEHNGSWTIGCWFPGDEDKARLLIEAAFSTMQALAKRGKAEEWTKILSSLR